MPRSGMTHPTKDNAVIQRLKSGKGNVAGLKMLVSVDARALVPVTVVGLDFYSQQDRSRSVSVRVEPVGGHGSIWVAPGDLIDDTPQAVKRYELRCLASDRARSVYNSQSDRQRRTELLNIRSEMTQAQKADFSAAMADRIGDKAAADAVAAINKMTGEYEFRRVAELAVKIRYGLDEVDCD